MVTSTLVDTLRRARASLRGQLVVLAIGIPLLGLTIMGGDTSGDLQLRMLVGLLEALLLLAASMRVALNAEAGFDPDAGTVAFEVLSSAPRLVSQVAIIGLVPALMWWLAIALMAVATPIGLAAIPLAFIVFVFSLGPALLAACAVTNGDRGWLPRSTLRAIRGRHLRVAAIVLAGGVAAAAAALPAALIGIVLTAVAGPLGFLGAGLAASATVPLFGCGVLATWRALEATIDEGGAADVDAEPEPDVAAAFAPAPVTAWMDGPAWDVALDAGAAWGTWIRIEAAAELGLRVSWHGGEAPEIAFASEAGVWTTPGPLGASGNVMHAAFPQGSTYVQLTSTARVPQAVSLALLVPAAANAA